MTRSVGVAFVFALLGVASACENNDCSSDETTLLTRPQQKHLAKGSSPAQREPSVLQTSGGSVIWCRSGIFCTADSADHGDGIKWSQENCHGYCFPKSCDSTWEDCVRNRNQEPPVCRDAAATDCSVPFEHAPISDHQANEALDKVIWSLRDDPDAMNLLGKHRPEVLDAIKP
eukprot:TRINITY_DN8277_c0_g1_i2.p3 TRINITY_DN8277_c0_g1~~TRINITY_DN8277_c0_g1_i2.p3  ORF type:complete len:173 (-),score=30.72 TRINITY_DN8277_c0_g1_i2:709-1227(-)